MEQSPVIMFENTEVNKSVYPCIYTSQKTQIPGSEHSGIIHSNWKTWQIGCPHSQA